MKKFLFLTLVAALATLSPTTLTAQCKDGSCGSDGDKAQALRKVQPAKVARLNTSKALVDTGTLVALKKTGASFTLIDARGNAKQHIPGSVAVKDISFTCPMSLEKAVGAKDDLVVTYCSGPKCTASTTVAAKLRQAGYRNVVEYREGIAGWQSYQSKCVAARQAQCGKGACGNKGACGGCQVKKVSANHGVSNINTAGLQALLRAKVPHYLVDARSTRAKGDQGIPGSNHITPASFKQSRSDLPSNKDSLIIAYCAGTKCGASKMVAAKLRETGYTNVVVYPAGMEGWRNASARTAGGRKASGCCPSKAKSSGSCSGGSCSDKKAAGSCSDKPAKNKKESCCGSCGGGCKS